MSMSGSASTGPAITIIIEDDDADLQISSEDLFLTLPQVNSVTRPTLHDFIVIDPLDDPLELRLGPSGASTPRRSEDARADRPDAPPAIDLQFSLSGEAITETKKRRKPSADDSLSAGVRLTCIICMDAMKEETSTICGHIFCKECILVAIQARKACPTCRRKLTSKDIHRIYLSS
ncbi:uncharacterized RING finger protein C548.05c-like [Selaginella moellendorffii]|uniref:uncharacterized RING finger protein C548.05c-like n=1 Tax=Selaginella moellendorffii TaxID=88036 RepID=UPI000D1C98FF|nr:uncharacterized RING finger protein C548.05c-like [Selaginella moellendorffii]|eukprot:XP_024535253.1 uncharacterized RING finger protein C548.05c-like [Selaginella moellendorffii]